MALVLADRVLETTTTTGSGTITLAGAEPGYQSFSVIGNANQTYYTLTTDSDWEVGIGTYTASGTTLSRDTVLASSNSGNRITLPAGSKKVFVTYPAEKSVNFDVSGNISALSGVITNVGYPSDASDAATKLYVDTLAAQGITYHSPVKYEVPNSTGNLTATYNNGTAGVSATLTNAGTLAAFVPDGVTATISDRVLIYNQTNGFENGVYTVTTVGNGSTAWVLTRATDADTYALKSPNSLGGGDAFYVTSGNTGAGETYLCNNSGVISFGSTAISFVQISAAQVYSAGNGLSLTNTVFSLATPVAVANGGTGTSATPTNGQLLIGNGSGYTLATLTAGSGVSITNSAGSITLTATGLGGTVTNVTASAPLASSGGTTPNISIANSTGTGSVVLDQGATISSATITAGVSAAITTITGTSANITTVTGTTAGFSSANITQLSGTSAGITTVTGTTTTFSSGTITQFGATSATVATISGTNVTYSNGNFTSATVTNLNSTSANITTLTGTTFGTTATTQLRGASGAITTLTGTTVTYSSGTITNLAATSITVTNTPAFVGNGTLTMNVSGTGLSGSQTFTANQAGNATFTVTSNATNANTGSTIVARDASGNFSAGTITATLNGNASTATSASTSTTQAKSDVSTNIATTAFGKNLFSTPSTSGTLDWNDNSNCIPGAGPTLLLGTATNGMGGGNYYLPFNVEYGGNAGTGNVTQMAIAYGTPGNELYMRGRYNSSWSSWVRYLNSSNYNSYAPTLTGTGASGTWGINITGNASTATNSTTTSQRAFSGDISTTGQGRFTGWYSGGAATGLAAEIGISASQGYIFVYNRDTSTYGTLNVAASAANMQFSGSTINVTSGALQQGGSQVLTASNVTTYMDAPNKAGSSYYQANTWIQLNGGYGLYAPSVNNAHWYPNNATTYGTWTMLGNRNGYSGVSMNYGNAVVLMQGGGNTTGFYNESYGWQIYWQSGTLYVYKSAYGGGTAAVALDSSNWTSYVTVSGLPTVNVTSSTSFTAVAGNHYILRGGATTVTLPASPSAGNVVWVTVSNGLTTNVVARNGTNIQGLAEDLTLDGPYAAVQLRYSDATMGWVFC